MSEPEPTRTASPRTRRTDTALSLALLGLVLLAGLGVAATGSTRQVLAWAWARHANVLSWYVRPLFVLPLAYFSYRHRVFGIAATLVALATSMAWFPRPDQVRPDVAEFLAFERAWLTSAWTSGKVLMVAVALVALGALCVAFWRRSLAYGLVVITSIAGGKLVWGVVEGGGTGWAMLVPALVGLLVCDGAVLYALRRMRARRGPEQPPTDAPPRPGARSGPPLRPYR
jgi:hypothetical protein